MQIGIYGLLNEYLGIARYNRLYRSSLANLGWREKEIH